MPTAANLDVRLRFSDGTTRDFTNDTRAVFVVSSVRDGAVLHHLACHSAKLLHVNCVISQQQQHT